MRLITSMFLGFLFLMSGCSNPDAWSDALKETAPPNPNRAHAQTQEAPRPDAESESRVLRKEVETQNESSTSEQGFQGEPESQPTMIAASLEGYPSCHNGAVRFYVNRRYKGQFDEDGNISLEVSPGELALEVWDSSGHWQKTVYLQEGQTLQVSFSCNEKSTNVRGVEGRVNGS